MRTFQVESWVTMLTLPCMQQRQGYIKVQQQWFRLTVLTTYAYSRSYPFPSFIYVRKNKMNKRLLPTRLINLMHVNKLYHICT
jgi:hypothetical protein